MSERPIEFRHACWRGARVTVVTRHSVVSAFFWDWEQNAKRILVLPKRFDNGAEAGVYAKRIIRWFKADDADPDERVPDPEHHPTLEEVWPR